VLTEPNLLAAGASEHESELHGERDQDGEAAQQGKHDQHPGAHGAPHATGAPLAGPSGAYPSVVVSLRRLASTVLVAALVAACGGSGSGSDDASDAGAPGTDPTATAPTAPVAPREDAGDGADAAALGPFDFVADAVGGGQVVGADFAGSETVVWFWAPW
jgi:hypothetical protein